MDMYEYFNLMPEDYASALVHLACLNTIQDRTYALIFGFVEFFPMECATEPIETAWQSLGLSKHRLFYRRKKLCVPEALDLYACTQRQNPFTFTWENCNNSVETNDLHHGSFFYKPYLSSYEKLPFIPVLWGVTRVHSLFPEGNAALMEILNYQKIAEWLEERLCFDLVKKNPELVGSMHCCLPNPLYRSCQRRLIPGDTKTPPQVQVRFVPREKREPELQNLTYCLLEKHSHGYTGDTPISVSGEYTTIPLASGDNEIGSFVYCQKRGLLDYSEFNGFVRNIHVRIGIHEGTERYVARFENGYTLSSEPVKRIQLASEFESGLDRFADLQVHDPGKRIRQTHFDKQKREQAQNLGQFLCNEPNKSRTYVKDILNRALSSVVIIDPYFDPKALFEYIKSIELKHIVPEVIVSAEGLKQEFQGLERGGTARKVPECKIAESECSSPTDNVCSKYSGSSNADIFEQLLTNEANRNTLTLSVMPGAGAFHDRFIIIDKQVWFSGNSLNALGNRLSVIIRLPDGGEILAILEELRDSSLKPFEEWLAEHRKAKGGAEGAYAQT